MGINNKTNVKTGFNSSKCVIDFHTDSFALVSVTDNYNNFGTNPENPHQDLTNSLQRCTVNKDIGQPFGNFSIELLNVKDRNNRSWLDILKPRQLVVIKMAGSDMDTPIPVMVGVINMVTKSSNYASESPTQTIEIIGGDIGQLLTDAQVYYKYLDDLGLRTQKSVRDISIPIGAINNIVSRVLKFIFAKSYNLEYHIDGEAKKVLDFLGYLLGDTDGRIVIPKSITIPENSLWGTVDDFKQDLFNEFFIDVIKDGDQDNNVAKKYRITREPVVDFDGYKCYMMLRPTPFISSEYGSTGGRNGTKVLWDDLPTHEIYDYDILTESLTIALNEVYNHYHVSQANFETTVSVQGDSITISELGDIYDVPSRLKYGQRMLSTMITVLDKERESQEQLDIIRTVIDESQKLPNWIARWTRLLYDWFYYNDEYRSGAFVLRGRPEIRVGSVLKYIEKDGYDPDKKVPAQREWNFYIQGVSHSYERYSRVQTTLQVVRGFDKNEKVQGTNIEKHSKNGLLKLAPKFAAKSFNEPVGSAKRNIDEAKAKEDNQCS